MLLWLVKDGDTNRANRQLCRTTVVDAFRAARVSMEKQLGPQVRQWTDLQVFTMNLPAPDGQHWEMETRRIAPKNN